MWQIDFGMWAARKLENARRLMTISMSSLERASIAKCRVTNNFLTCLVAHGLQHQRRRLHIKHALEPVEDALSAITLSESNNSLDQGEN